MSTVFDKRRIQWMRNMEKRGYNRSQISKRLGISRQRVSQLLGPLPNRGNRKEHVVYALDEPWQKAIARAKELGLLIRSGPTAGGGSVALMIEKIGEGELVVSYPSDGEGEEESDARGCAQDRA